MNATKTDVTSCDLIEMLLDGEHIVTVFAEAPLAAAVANGHVLVRAMGYSQPCAALTLEGYKALRRARPIADLDLPAGWELDLLIAEEICGWKVKLEIWLTGFALRLISGKHGDIKHVNGMGAGGTFAPSLDLGDAMTVIDHLLCENDIASFSIVRADHGFLCRLLRFDRMGDPVLVETTPQKSMAMAICHSLVALRPFIGRAPGAARALLAS
jgi:hypothetical protein